MLANGNLIDGMSPAPRYKNDSSHSVHYSGHTKLTASDAEINYQLQVSRHNCDTKFYYKQFTHTASSKTEQLYWKVISTDNSALPLKGSI